MSAIVIALLTGIYRKLKVFTDLPHRVAAIERENAKAHGDLWNELRRLAQLVERTR